MERKKDGRAVELEEVDLHVHEGLKVAFTPDLDHHHAQYAYLRLVFLELDLVVKSELGLLQVEAILSRRLFMPPNFVAIFGSRKGKPMEVLIIEEVQNMALGNMVKEFWRQRNCAMLASWGELKIKDEKDKLRTMTWADHIGVRYIVEPFQRESVERYITLPGQAADYYLNQTKLKLDKILEALEVWASSPVDLGSFPSFYHNRNTHGIDQLRVSYGDMHKAADGSKFGARRDGDVKTAAPLVPQSRSWQMSGRTQRRKMRVTARLEQEKTEI